VRLVRTVEHVVEAAGLGIAGRLDGHDVRVGNRAHIEAGCAGVPDDFAAAATAIVADGLTPIFVALDGRVAGVAGIGDRLRPDARETVAALRARGVHVRILSGDHPDVVRRVASELGLPDADAFGGLTPEAKRDIVAHLGSGLASQHFAASGTGSGTGDVQNAAKQDLTPGAVVMVGDGVNDAAALALADVGIAVHGGTGATIVAADVVLTRRGVAPIVDILDGSRRLRGVIRRNLGFSLLYNSGACALALAGYITPLAAAVLMPCSSLIVVLSSALTPTFTRPRAQRARLVPDSTSSPREIAEGEA